MTGGARNLGEREMYRGRGEWRRRKAGGETPPPAYNLLMGIPEVLGPARDEILRVAAAHGARNVRVFGSVARGDARSDSDVDLLVDFDREVSLMDHVRFSLALESALHRKVDVATEAELKPAYKDQVLREAVSL